MDIKQLEAFVQVIRQGSFSKAAEKLYLTQPTVSAHIGALERELDQKLILRTAKEALPTEAGQTLYTYAVQMLDLREQALFQLKGGSDEPRGVVTLAASSVPHQYLLPGLLAAFRDTFPLVTFDVLSFDSAGVAEAVMYGKAQIGLTGTALSDPQCCYEPFFDDELIIVTPNTEPYRRMGKSGFGIDQLETLPFIIREPGSGTRKETEAFLASQGIGTDDLGIIAQMDNPDAIKRSVSQGLGISVLSHLAAEDYVKLGLLLMHRPAAGPIRRKLYMVRRKSGILSPAAGAFLTFARSYFKIDDPGQTAPHAG